MVELEQWAWAAGLFEGEGNISNRRTKRYWVRTLTLGMTDEDRVRLFHVIVGAGTVTAEPPSKKQPHAKQMWRWRCYRWPDIERILTALLPYLGERRGKAARELLANPAQPYNGDKTHCKHGHPFAGENLRIVEKAGYRQRVCKTCNRAWKREEYWRKRAGYGREKHEVETA